MCSSGLLLRNVRNLQAGDLPQAIGASLLFRCGRGLGARAAHRLRLALFTTRVGGWYSLRSVRLVMDAPMRVGSSGRLAAWRCAAGRGRFVRALRSTGWSLSRVTRRGGLGRHCHWSWSRTTRSTHGSMRASRLGRGVHDALPASRNRDHSRDHAGRHQARSALGVRGAGLAAPAPSCRCCSITSWAFGHCGSSRRRNGRGCRLNRLRCLRRRDSRLSRLGCLWGYGRRLGVLRCFR